MVPIGLILLTQLVAAVVLVEVLVTNMPNSLRHASQENCFRSDGSRSSNRADRETRACFRLRCDLWLVFGYVLLIGNAVFMVVDHAVMPAGLTATVMGAYDPDMDEWKEKMRKRKVYTDVESINRDRARKASDKSNFSELSLRRGLTLSAVVGVVCVLASIFFLREGTLRAYKDFSKGVRSRNEEYFKVDMTRLQTREAELAFRQRAEHSR